MLVYRNRFVSYLVAEDLGLDQVKGLAVDLDEALTGCSNKISSVFRFLE